MQTNSSSQSYRLMEQHPAEDFADAHLLGNGAIGASVFGGIPYERILLNHDTLWSGSENSKITKQTSKYFLEARDLVLDGKVKDATNLINEKMLGYWSESFLPLGYLNLTIGLKEDRRTMVQKRILENDFPAKNYSRTLTLDDAVERIEYDQRGRHYTREMFVSFPDNVIAVRLAASGGSLEFAMSLDSPLHHEQTIGEGYAAVTGRAPDRVEPYGPRYTPNVVYHRNCDSAALRFAACAKVVDTDGTVSCDAMRTYVSDASYATVLVSLDTNFQGAGVKRDNNAYHILERCEQILQKASKDFTDLLQSHITDYTSLYRRFSMDLGPQITDSLPTTRRLDMIRNIDDPSLMALVVQYTRYLLIASSRPGTQAANLQGIWNPLIYPSWACNYTTNINVQMNYWGVEQFALPECHLPMSDLVAECAQSGTTAARKLYGADGWVTHHNTDLWRFSALAGEDASWAWWPFGGFWMCQHLWQHYEYTGDRDYLQEIIYPVLRGAAEFLCSFAVMDRQGFYVTAPSTSPENKFFIGNGSIAESLQEVNAGNRFSPNRPDTAEVCKAATMDLAILLEVFGNLEQTVSLLGIDEPLLPRMKEIASRLMPFKIGRHGQLQEWDEDYEECMPGMGHLSNLYPVYPGSLFTQKKQPEFFEAARKSLERRVRHGAGGPGWPGSWQVALWARYGEGSRCEQVNLTMPENMGASLLTRGSLQVDAVLGWGAGIGEMLLQSHDGTIRLLPALPATWRQGEIRGFRARGGYTVSMKWHGGNLEEVSVTAVNDGPCHICVGDHSRTINCFAGQTVTLDGQLRQPGSI